MNGSIRATVFHPILRLGKYNLENVWGRKTSNAAFDLAKRIRIETDLGGLPDLSGIPSKDMIRFEELLGYRAELKLLIAAALLNQPSLHLGSSIKISEFKIGRWQSAEGFNYIQISSFKCLDSWVEMKPFIFPGITHVYQESYPAS